MRPPFEFVPEPAEGALASYRAVETFNKIRLVDRRDERPQVPAGVSFGAHLDPTNTISLLRNPLDAGIQGVLDQRGGPDRTGLEIQEPARAGGPVENLSELVEIDWRRVQLLRRPTTQAGLELVGELSVADPAPLPEINHRPLDEVHDRGNIDATDCTQGSADGLEALHRRWIPQQSEQLVGISRCGCDAQLPAPVPKVHLASLPDGGPSLAHLLRRAHVGSGSTCPRSRWRVNGSRLRRGPQGSGGTS